jgi:hypothetical protein
MIRADAVYKTVTAVKTVLKKAFLSAFGSRKYLVMDHSKFSEKITDAISV